MIFVFLLCVFMLHCRGSFSHKKTKKESGVIIVRPGLGNVYFIFYWKEMIQSSLANHWLDMNLRWHKRYGYADIGKLFQAFSGEVKHFVH